MQLLRLNPVSGPTLTCQPLPIHQACAWCRVQGYPTIKSVVGGKVRDYNGERSASALRSFALSLLPDKVHLPCPCSSAHVQRVALRCLHSLCPCCKYDSVVMHKAVRLPRACARHTASACLELTAQQRCMHPRATVAELSALLPAASGAGMPPTPPCLQVTVLAKKGDLGTFLSRCSGKGGASSGACAVLVTDKAATPSVFKALAAEFEGRLGFAAARKGALELVSELGLTK